MVYDEKRSIMDKVPAYREDYNQLVSSFKTLRQSAEAYLMTTNTANRIKFNTINEKLDKSTVTLEESRRIISDTENIGTSIISNLRSQREQLLTSSDHVQATKSITIDTKALLQVMKTKFYMKSVFLYFVMIILAALIFLVVYYGYIKSSNKSL